MKMKKGRISIENPSPAVYESVADVGIPEELIREILLYLPVKSLGRFKCVSKPWRSWISSPLFIKSHFSTCLKDGQHFNHQLLFVSEESRNYGMKHCSLFAALRNPSTNVVSDIEYPFRKPNSSVQIVGIVNGLICLFVDEKHLYIWNPVLKQSKLLPVSGSIVLHRDTVVYQSKFNVYSLRGDSWRMTEGFTGLFTNRNGTYANGNILFPIVGGALSSGEKWMIFSYNMASDMCEEMQAPCCYEASLYDCVIGSFGGSLSILFYMFNRADLWVRDENGFENSWSKVFSLGYYDGVDAPCPERHHLKTVVCNLGDGEILLEDALWLVVYRTKTKDFRRIQFDSYLYQQFCVYVESLVAL